MRPFLKKILGALRALARRILDIFIRLILAVVYFIVLFPFGIILRFATDFLDTKKELTAWKPRPEIKDLKGFLDSQ